MDLNLTAISSFNSPSANVGRNGREREIAADTNARNISEATPDTPPPAARPILNNAISATTAALQSQLFDRQRETTSPDDTAPASPSLIQTVSGATQNERNAANDTDDARRSPPPAPREQTGNEASDSRFSGNPARQAVVQYQANQSLLQDAGPSSNRGSSLSTNA